MPRVYERSNSPPSLHGLIAVRQLHREFLRAGSNVMQTFTFYASEDKLENRGNYVAEKISVSMQPGTLRSTMYSLGHQTSQRKPGAS